MENKSIVLRVVAKFATVRIFVYRQLFQQLASCHIFQHLHLLYGDAVQPDEPFTLWNPVLDKYGIQDKTRQTSLLSKVVKFDHFKTGIVNRFPRTQKLDGISLPIIPFPNMSKSVSSFLSSLLHTCRYKTKPSCRFNLH